MSSVECHKSMNKIKKVLIIGLMMLPAISAAEHLHISTGFTPPVSDYYSKVLAEIDKRLEDISISFEVLPAERSLALVNDGINDGECCRIPPVVKKQYQNLVEVQNSFFTTRFSVFSKQQNLSIKNFNELKTYSVGVPKGWKLLVNKITEVDPRELFIVTTPEQLIRMINEDRVEAGLVGYLSGLHVIRNMNLQGIYAAEPPLVSKDLYLMLNKKHKNLIPIFNYVISEMKKDGTIERIYGEYH